jgi:hypothetical protein
MEPIKVTCPHCGDDHCFEENQTIPGTGDTDQQVTSWMCVGCGYTSTTLNQADSDIITSYEETTAQLVVDLKWTDPETNLVWYPLILNFPSYGIIFPDGTHKNNWKWMAAPAVDIAEGEREKYPIPGSPGSFYTRKINMEQGKHFETVDFYEACKYIGFIQPVN